LEGCIKVECEEEQKRDEKKNREKVLAPVRHHETIIEGKNIEKLTEKVWKMPRRWHIYQ
jgi:hypothetical protein